MDYRDEMDFAVEAARATLPAEAYCAAQWSLHYGPSGGGAEMSYKDALTELRAWADSVNDWIVTDIGYGCEGEDGELDCGCDADEGCDGHEFELGRIDSVDIIRAVVGKELAAYL
jgi:hypothetical protein